MRHRTVIFLLTIFLVVFLVASGSENPLLGERRRSTLRKTAGRLGTQELRRKRQYEPMKRQETGDVTPGGANLQKRKRKNDKKVKKDKRRRRRRRRKRVEEDSDMKPNRDQLLHEKRRNRRIQKRVNNQNKRNLNPLKNRVEEVEKKDDKDDDDSSSNQGTSGGLIVLYVLCGLLAVLTICCFFLISFSMVWYCCKDIIKRRKAKYVKGKSGYLGAREKIANDKALGKERKNEIMNNIRADNAEYHQLEDAV